ncbi:MAG: tetratricopeptide repeat protein [Flavobacteriales bacterium]|nr:tetratricopeptide repeat protein [Flavobacteriales bacterium]
MRSNWFILALLLLPLTARCAVQADPDSLLRALAIAQTDSSKVGLLNELASAYSETEPDSTIAFGTKAKELGERSGQRPGLAEALTNIGIGHMRKDEYALARSYLERALDLWEAMGNDEQRSRLHDLLGQVAEQQSDFPEALKHDLAELRYVEKSGDRSAFAELTSTIGNVYEMMGQHDEAAARQLAAIRIYEELGDSLGIARASNNLGMVYDTQGKYAEGLASLTRALDIAKKMGNPMGIAICTGSIANHYHRMGNYEEALRYTLQTVPLFEQMDNPFNLAASHINIGELLTKLKRYKEAREHLEVGLSLSQEIGARQWIANAHSGLTDLHTLQGDHERALYHYRLYNAYQDSIANEENVRKSVQVQMQYDFDKKEAEARAEQEKKDALAAKEIQRKELQRNALLGFGAVGIVFAVIDTRRRRRIKQEHARSEALLLNILPAEVAEELKAKGEADAKQIDQVTVLFTDFKGFTAMSEQLSAKDLVRDLNECFSAFDRICEKHRIEKIKTIGDAYMAAGGLPTPNTTHATDVIKAAWEMRYFIAEGKARKAAQGLPYFEIRIGVHTGPVVAGIVGVKKFQYDIWGDTVNIASRMESSGEVGHVNISEATYALVKDEPGFMFTPRGKVQAKGKGEMEMYFVAST